MVSVGDVLWRRMDDVQEGMDGCKVSRQVERSRPGGSKRRIRKLRLGLHWLSKSLDYKSHANRLKEPRDHHVTSPITKHVMVPTTCHHNLPPNYLEPLLRRIRHP